MNKLKALAAAALLCSTSAFAVNVNNDAAELVMIVWDEDVATYAFDTGLTIGQIKSLSGNASFNIAGTSAWAAYAALDTNLNDNAAFSGTRWGMFAVDANDELNYNATDLNAIVTGAKSTQGANTMADLTNIITVAYYQTASDFRNLGMAGAGDSVYAAKGTAGHFISFLTGGFDGGLDFSNAVGSSSNMFLCTVDESDSFQTGTCKPNFNHATGPFFMDGQPVTASFNGTTLTVSAVPEPATYGLMIAGLLAVGAAARRRRA